MLPLPSGKIIARIVGIFGLVVFYQTSFYHFALGPRPPLLILAMVVNPFLIQTLRTNSVNPNAVAAKRLNFRGNLNANFLYEDFFVA